MKEGAFVECDGNWQWFVVVVVVAVAVAVVSKLEIDNFVRDLRRVKNVLCFVENDGGWE